MSFCDNQSIKMLSFGDGKLRKEETDKDELIKKLPVKRVKSNLFGLSSESRLNEVNIRIERFWRTLKRECVYLVTIRKTPTMTEPFFRVTLRQKSYV